MDEVVLRIKHRPFEQSPRLSDQMWVMRNYEAAMDRLKIFHNDPDIAVTFWCIYALVPYKTEK